VASDKRTSEQLQNELKFLELADCTSTYQGLSFFAYALFTRAQSTKVFDRLGHSVTKETHDNAATLGGSLNLDIEVNLVGNLIQFAEKKRGEKKYRE